MSTPQFTRDDQGIWQIVSEENPVLCNAVGCRGHRARWYGSVSRFCERCRSALYRKRHPWKTRLARIRDRARRKQLEFDLTIEWLRKSVSMSGLALDDCHIDRCDPRKGYTADNCQVLSIRRNCQKAAHDKKLHNGQEVDVPF